MFAGPSISENGVTEVKVYADSLIGSRRLAFGAANIAFVAILRCSRTKDGDDTINRDQSRPMRRSCIPKCMAPGCIDKPIAGCVVTAIDGPRVTGIVVMIIMTLVTFVITGAGHRIVISSVHDAGFAVDKYSGVSDNIESNYIDLYQCISVSLPL